MAGLASVCRPRPGAGRASPPAWRLLVLLLAGIGPHLSAAEAMPSFDELRPLFAQALIPEAAAELDAHADLPLYRIRATYHPEQCTIDGHVRIEFCNATGVTLHDLGVYTFANAECFHGAGLHLSHVAVDGREVQVLTPVEGGADLLVTLPRALAPGQSCVLSAAFQCSLSATGGDNGLDALDGGCACLYAWYPVLAGYEHGRWQLHPIDGICDPSVLEMAHVLVELTVPDGVQVASGGSVIAVRRGTAGGRITTISAPFTRDLALVLSTHLEEASVRQGGTTISSWSPPDARAAGGSILAVAGSALGLFGAFAAYPYAHLTAVQCVLAPQVGGMESSGLILINASIQVPALRQAPPEAAQRFMTDLVVSHEVAHQWFYGLVGSDAFLCPWLDESLADWSDSYFCEQRAPAALTRAAWQMDLEDSASSEVAAADATGSVASYQGGLERYSGVVYSRGALMYQALRLRLGPQAFLAFLQDYVAANRFRVASQVQWRQALVRALGAQGAQEFAAKWLEGRGLTVEDLQAVAHVAPPLSASSALDGR